MKTSWTTLLTTLVVLTTVLMDSVAASCKSACQSQLVHFREDACQNWCERLPGLDLFNHCSQGFNKGKTAACERFCKKTSDLGSLKSMRLDACSSLKGVPPMERQQACEAGFPKALDLEKNTTSPDIGHDEHDGQHHHEASNSHSNEDGQNAGTTGSKLEANEEAAGGTKNARVKKVIEPERRSLLDDARKEAEAAFSSPEGINIEL